jgi:hypothetical protein
MFAEACTIARQFTKPIVISYRQPNGKCGSVVGAIVVVNEDGWFVTAFHIIKAINDMQQSIANYNRILAIRQQIENDKTINPNVRRGKLNQNPIPNDARTHISIWCGYDGLVVNNFYGIPAVDLGIGQIQNFDRNSIQTYPSFKDPSHPMEPGRSLCKMGFPLINPMEPVFNELTNSFTLPFGLNDMPFFPLDGIFTRNALVALPPGEQNPHPFPLMFLETSSPGLKGQSGGPTFDTHGNIWAIQSSTQSYPLGFEANKQMNHKQAEHIENQYLNIGLGVHSQTITGLLREKNIIFRLSLR